MENLKKYVVGVDFGSDSVRSVVVDSRDGKEIASSVKEYPRWKRGEYCSPKENRYRQHPLDYVETFTESVREALDRASACLRESSGAACRGNIRELVGGISFDTTASTPVLLDASGVPLALSEEFKDEPDAMFILWKDHTAVAEADEINRLAHSREIDYTEYCGGSYSCEWAWAKVLHVIRTNPRVAAAASSWVEHADWMGSLLTGRTSPGDIVRGRCTAGHKAMWNSEWGGYPPAEFFRALDPELARIRESFSDRTATADIPAGHLSHEWADRLGLGTDVTVGTGMIDCHAGAVGAGISDGVMVKVIGTSTCDIITAPYSSVPGSAVRGICGQVDGSVIPGRVGFEAGQAAFGDVFAWFRRLLAWPLSHSAISAGQRAEIESALLQSLSECAERLPLSETDPVATDWFNGRRTPDLDAERKATIAGLDMSTDAPEIYRALVEATAFGSRAILERFISEGVEIGSVMAVGGISRKSPFVMQTLADVMGIPIAVLDSSQACALGAAMYASVHCGLHPDISAAQRSMRPSVSRTYLPDPSRRGIYDVLYARYLGFTE